MRQRTAEAALVEEYRPLVRRIAHSLKRRVYRAEIDDLMQAGMEGLIRAAPRFKPESGASFETFIGYRISGAMVDALRETDWAPRPVARNTRKIAAAIRVVEVREQRPARESEVAAYMGLALKEYHELLLECSTHYVYSMDEAPQAMDSAVPGDGIDEEDAEEKVRAAIASLPERERYIIEQTYLRGLTLGEVGRALGISESRACQIRTSAVARLRARLMLGPGV